MRYVLLLLVLTACAPKTTTYLVPGDCPAVPERLSYEVPVTSSHTFFNTNNWNSPSELSTCLPAPHHLEDTTVVAIYQVKFLGIQPGDVVSSSFSAEVTCEIPVGSFLAWFVEIRDSNGGLVLRTPKHGTNVSLEEHHHTFGEQFYQGFTSGGDYTVTVYAYAAIGWWDYDVANSHLVIEQGYGSLQGVIFR